MQKKYIVRLSEAERQQLTEVIKKRQGSSQKVRRAHILLQTDANGPNRTDQLCAQAYHCRTKTVENIRQHFVEKGFERALETKKREHPPTPKLSDGEQEARIIATRLGSPPAGYANRSLRLLANQVVELGIVESVSHETVRKLIKKTV
jgi:Homeodomain-like domain